MFVNDLQVGKVDFFLNGCMVVEHNARFRLQPPHLPAFLKFIE